jgi:hypothetical protein
MMGDPNYALARRISPEEILSMSDNELMYSYTTVEVKDFQFDYKLQYPSIPCFADEVTTCYPRSGVNVILSGVEYLTAKTQGCAMEILGGTLIPFRHTVPYKPNSTDEDIENLGKTDWQKYKSKAFPPSEYFGQSLEKIFQDMPFREVISELQSERRKHPKGTISNLLYKEMGNSIYGSVCKGLSHKVRYDIKTDRMVRMEANEIANPILAS